MTVMRAKLLFLILTAVTWQFPAHAATPIEQSFLVREFQDGSASTDLFELWQVRFDRSADTPLIIQVASFVTLGDETRVFIWTHTAASVKEIQPGVFKAECNGRLNPFAGLDVVLEISGKRIKNISGSTRAGTKGQAIVAYQVDHKVLKVPLNLANPSWQP